MIGNVGDRQLRGIDDHFPRFVGSSLADHAATAANIPTTFRDDARTDVGEKRRIIAAESTGYIQFLDDETFLKLASKHDLVLRLQYQLDDFVHVGRALIEAWPPKKCDDACADDLRSVFSIGSRRSALQDLRFLVDELIQIAAGALSLSPGVNDPLTAVTCLD